MIKDFKDFLIKQNAIALAIGVIIGAAVSKVVSSIVDNILNPIVSLLLPAGDWRQAGWVIREGLDAAGKPFVTKITYGQVIGALIDFAIIGLLVFAITKAVLPKPDPAAPTKECPQCKDIIPKGATRCKSCTQPVA